MRKLKVVLSTFALVVAVGATFATQYNASTLKDQFIYVPASAGDPAECQRVNVDCGGSGAVCTYQSTPVRAEEDIDTSCGTQLRFNP